MSKKKKFTKDLVTPDEVLSNYFQIGTLVYFKDGSFVVKKSDQSDFAMAVGCSIMCSEEANDLFQIIDANKPYPTANTDKEIIVPINNIKVRNINTGTVYYCSEINVVNCAGSVTEDYEDRKVIYNNTSTTLRTILKASKFGNCHYYKNLNCMEKKKVDYSKDIQITNPKTNETFPARLLVNDPEFGVIVGFTDNDEKKWIHSEYYSDYESVQEVCGFLEVSNVPEIEEGPIVNVGNVVSTKERTLLIIEINPDYITGIDIQGKGWALLRKDILKLLTGDEAAQFCIYVAANTGTVLLANGSLFDLIGGWWYKCVIEGLTWVFQFEEIKTTGDVIASLVINVESGICVPESILQECPFANLHHISNAENLEVITSDEVLKIMLRK